MCLQISYQLLAALDQGMTALMTGPNTNPQTLATALTAFQATLPVLASTNTTITELNKYIVSLFFALLLHYQLTVRSVTTSYVAPINVKPCQDCNTLRHCIWACLSPQSAVFLLLLPASLP